MTAVERIGRDDLEEATGTKGLRRQVALADDGFWIGIATADPAAASGWHHHTDNETLVYLIDGTLRIEFGEDGDRYAEAAEGEFLHVPPNTIHREVNPASGPTHALVIRVGKGEPVVNVPGPGS
ncbi:MAG: cupin domain-containing protein [Acidimicrobiia bacterium]